MPALLGLLGCTGGPAGSADSNTPAPTRPLDLLVVLDISTSWSQTNFALVRDGLASMLTAQQSRAFDGDRVGLVAFNGRYADEWTAWTPPADAGLAPSWTPLNVASRSGAAQTSPTECLVNRTDDFGDGGCYPQMPRQYTDEAGTDPTVGLTLAGQMIAASPGTGAGAIVVVTDGIANGMPATNGAIRAAAGYTETRWPEYVGPVPHTTAEIEADSPALTAQLYADTGYDTFVVSLGQSGAFMDEMATGVGSHRAVASGTDIGPALTDVVAAY